MPEKYRDIVEKVVVGGGLAVLGVTITALLDKKLTIFDKIKNALAGVIAGVLAAYILKDTQEKYELYKEIFLVALASFIGVFWPIFQEVAIFLIKKYITKTLKNDIPDNNSK